MEQTAFITAEGLQKPLTDWFTIGRAENCDLRTENHHLEERHARIERKADGWFLKDLRSSSGTWLNQSRVLEAYLEHGDMIRCGDLEVIFSKGQTQISDFPIKSRNPEWSELLGSMAHVAQTPFPILLMGPSGTGKDVLTQALHKHSPRAHGPLVSVNCGALTESLVESELFGHIKGSFTGALSDRKGAFEAGRGGTLFLDEIGDLPISLQSKLLRALENNEIRPVGSDRTIKTDVRIIAATHHDLNDRVREGLFRQDLFYRLNVISITPPPLKDRMEDFQDLLYGFCRSLRVRFSVAAIRRLEKHPWPGNIRELKNLVSRACALYPGQSIEESHVEKLLATSPRSTSFDTSLPDTGPRTHLPVIQEIERQMIIKRLRANQGNQRRTANDLGLPKSTLHDRIRTYGIDLEACKAP